MIYAYLRVSTEKQNLDRQKEMITKYFEDKVDEYKIILEKESGKDFNRQFYQKLKKRIKENDELIICSIDRLGRNYTEIIREWQYFNDKKVKMTVLDMPILNTNNQIAGLDGTFISNLVLQILSYVAEKERDKIKERQRQGIDAAMKRGVQFGRPKLNTPDNWLEIMHKYENSQITFNEAVKMSNLSRATFAKMLKEYRACNSNKKIGRLYQDKDIFEKYYNHEITTHEARKILKLDLKTFIEKYIKWKETNKLCMK